MQIRSWQLAAVGLIFSTSIMAAKTEIPNNTCNRTLAWHPVFSFAAGAAFNADAGRSINFPAQGDIFSYFNYQTDRDDAQSYALFGGFLGAEFLVYPEWSVQAGLGYYQPAQFDVRGNVTQGVDEDSQNTYPYQYYIRSQQFLAEGKLLYNWNKFHPYVQAGVGAAINDVHGFNLTIMPEFTTVSNQFASRTTTSFSYSVGLGFDVDITAHSRLGIGYRFADLGQPQSGSSMVDTVATPNTLAQTHLYTNQMLAQLTLDLA